MRNARFLKLPIGNSAAGNRCREHDLGRACTFLAAQCCCEVPLEGPFNRSTRCSNQNNTQGPPQIPSHGRSQPRTSLPLPRRDVQGPALHCLIQSHNRSMSDPRLESRTESEADPQTHPVTRTETDPETESQSGPESVSISESGGYCQGHHQNHHRIHPGIHLQIHLGDRPGGHPGGDPGSDPGNDPQSECEGYSGSLLEHSRLSAGSSYPQLLPWNMI